MGMMYSIMVMVMVKVVVIVIVIVNVAVTLSVASSQRDGDNGNSSYGVVDEWYKISGIKMWYWGDCGASSKCHSTKMACPTRGVLAQGWCAMGCMVEWLLLWISRGFGKAVNFWKVDMVWRWGTCWNTSLTFWEPDHIEQLSLVFLARVFTQSVVDLQTRDNISLPRKGE